MKLSNAGAALALLAAMAAVSSYADDRASKGHARSAAGMQAIAVAPGPGEPGHGWRYFSDVRQARAVVISPKGDYYYSRGKGLQLVFQPQGAN